MQPKLDKPSGVEPRHVKYILQIPGVEFLTNTQPHQIMAPEPASTPFGAMPAQTELDAISNRIQIALAKREELVRSWTSKSAREDKIRKTDEELDAEDALLFRNQPAYLGVGCPIPEKFLIGEADRSKKSLEARLGKGLQASKRRDAEEKAASAKRGLNQDSSDEEEGRSSLGKKKKRNLPMKVIENPIYAQKAVEQEPAVNTAKDVKDTEGDNSNILPIRPKKDKAARRNEKKKKKLKREKLKLNHQSDSQGSSC